MENDITFKEFFTFGGVDFLIGALWKLMVARAISEDDKLFDGVLMVVPMVAAISGSFITNCGNTKAIKTHISP